MLSADWGRVRCLPNLPGQAMVPFSDNAGAASSVFGILQYGGSALLAYLSGVFYDATLLTVTISITAEKNWHDIKD